MTKNGTTAEGAPTARVVARGDGTSLLAGLLLAGAIAVVLVGATFGTLRAGQESRRAAKVNQVRAAARHAAKVVEDTLRAEDLDAMRRFVREAGSMEGVERCRVMLSDGTLLADSMAGSSVVEELPERWAGTGAGGATTEQVEGSGADQKMVCTRPLNVHGKGGASVEVTGVVHTPFFASSDRLWAAVGIPAGAGLLAWLASARVLLSRFRGLGAIQQALRSHARSGSSTASMRLAPGFGDEALAWNKLLGEYDAMRDEALVRGLGQRGSGSSPAEGDLSFACDAMWQGLVVVDDALTIKYCNGAAAVFLRGRREELVGTDVRKRVTDLNILSALQAASGGKSKQKVSFEVKAEDPLQGKGATSVFRYGVRPLRSEGSGAALILIEDVTQQRVADEARNAFVAQATHELRTPLTSIRLFVETMVEEGEKDPAVRAKCINVIGQEARRLERIVGDMLSVAEIEAGSLKIRKGDVRLDSLLEELRTDYRAQAEDKEIALEFDLPPKLPVLQGDRDRLGLAVHNVLGNAIKYTPQGGRVSMKVSEEGPSLVIAVTDNGIGIRPEEQELIFERFYRAKDRRITGITGSGLGLALAREVVRLHGGEIRVTSEVDKGSTFTITLPLTPAGVAGQARAA